MGEEGQGHMPAQLCLDAAGGGTAALGPLISSAQLERPLLGSFLTTD